jgi:hypothetical protein
MSRRANPKKEAENAALELGVWVADGRVAEVLPHAASRIVLPDKPVSRVVQQPYDIQPQLHAWWGGSDNLPIRVQTRLAKTPIAGRAVFDMASMMVGKGVFYVADKDLQQGESLLKRAYDPEIEAFNRRNRLYHNFLFGIANDIAHVYNGFVEFNLNSEASKIVQVVRKPASYCRISRIDDKSLRSENLYYSAAFANGYFPANYDDPRHVATIPLYDPYDFEWLDKAIARGVRKFAMHIKPPSPAEEYYAVAPWNGIYLDSGWADVAAAVPRVVKAMQDNQIALKYIIYISEQYMISRFPKWGSMLDAQRTAAQATVTKEIENKLVGVDNVFSSLTMIAREGADGKMYGKIDIKPVEDKAKEGTWIPDAAAANREILYAHMIHPTQVGVQAAGGSEAGSGSDKRESFNTAISQIAVLQAHVFEPINSVVKDFNNWAYTFLPDNILHTTTNNSENGIVPKDSSPVVKN